MSVQVNIEVTTKVTLVLDEKAAQWLKSLMQNPIQGNSLNDETDKDRDMRSQFWDALLEIK